jgi:hypothetical protein
MNKTVHFATITDKLQQNITTNRLWESFSVSVAIYNVAELCKEIHMSCSEHEYNNHLAGCSHKITAQTLLIYIYSSTLTNSNGLVQLYVLEYCKV